MKQEYAEETFTLTNERKRARDAEEIQSVGSNAGLIPESSRNLEVHFEDYSMVQIPKSFSRTVIQQKQLGSGEIQFGENFNASNDNVLVGLELIAILQRRTRGFRRLSKIHGVDLRNETEGTCPRRLLKREILEGCGQISQDEVNQLEKVAANANNVVFEEEKVKRMDFLNEKRFVQKTNRTRRKLNTGKRTFFSWMISVKTIKSRERVYYRDHRSKSVSLGGDAVADGILCDCCSKVVSISEFEFHSWKQEFFGEVGRISNPLQNICLGRGRGLCLLQWLAETWDKQTEFSSRFYHLVRVAQDQNDDICSICGEKGELICCDGCPSTFHQSCLGLQAVPAGDWHCMSCCCKYCGFKCGKIEINFAGFIPFEMSSECLICERRYHQCCLRANGGNGGPSKHLPLCGKGCNELYERLQKLLGVKHRIEDGLCWSLICRTDVDPNLSRLEPAKVESNAKLGVALSILSESFMPYIEEGTGANILQSVIYSSGSNLPRLDCKGFFTAILERDYEIISVASIRIHGNSLAEMPFVATVSAYRKQGMFGRLLQLIEQALSHLNVELLVVPAVEQVKKTWIRTFRFEPIDSRTENILKSVNLLVCRGTEILQKKIPRPT